AATAAVAAKTSRVRLLNSLGIPGIGAANARAICRALGYDWEKIECATTDELVEIDGIGDILAEGYTRWWQACDGRNRRMVSDILACVTLDPEEGRLAGGTAGAAGAAGGTAGAAGGTAGAAEADGGADGNRPPLEGRIFVITGSLETYANRDALKERIEDAGGKVTGSVSEKTNYLINNDSGSGSSKNKKAKQLGVKIITEAEVNEMMDG
ncbi:MAG: hypothetical protein LBT52_00445, partial [Clostridiales Family XIII bacterium]|nr:hypothetical protein [Clostridiales Family XIII bacterium]